GRVACIGEVNLGARDVRVGRDAVVAELWVDDLSGLVDHDPLVERPTNSLRYRALNLPMQLHGIDHRARVRGVDTLQDRDLAGDAMDSDTEARVGESDAAV